MEFPSAESANKALAMNGTPIPGSNNRHFKLNWASGGGLIDRRSVAPHNFPAFLGADLTKVTSAALNTRSSSVISVLK